MTSERIPLVDVAWQHAQVRDAIDRAVDRLLRDPTCDGLPFVQALEADVAAYHGPGWEAVGVQSGTAAEVLLLRGLGIGPGDEVITVPNSDLATTAAISHVGARFRLVDVRETGHAMDPASVEAAITPSTRAILVVHMHGAPGPAAELAAIARDRGLLLLEDATLALGARHGGRLAGTLGDGAFVSFAPRKVIGGTGNGGMVLTRDPEVASRVRLLRGYGQDPAVMDRPIATRQAGGQVHVAEGYNLKLDGIQAAVVHAKFQRLDAWRALRTAVAERYDALLADVPGFTTPRRTPGDERAWRNYTVLSEDRDGLRAHLDSASIATGTLYAPPVHLQPVYAHLGMGRGSLPVAERLGDRLLNLPIFPGMRDDQVERVAHEVRTFQERHLRGAA
jgi:dTDP-4-amino-4,6-dideoxygalactose transaminase